jgi:hypothetical protein
MAVDTGREFYVVYPKKGVKIDGGEVDRIVVMAQNSLAEVEESGGRSIRLVFPDNFQAREFRDKLSNYFPNWIMRRIKR